MIKPDITEWYEDDYLRVKITLGDREFIWYDNANVDYPEDLCWHRLIRKVFDAGFEMGRSSVLMELREHLDKTAD